MQTTCMQDIACKRCRGWLQYLYQPHKGLLIVGCPVCRSAIIAPHQQRIGLREMSIDDLARLLARHVNGLRSESPDHVWSL